MSTIETEVMFSLEGEEFRGVARTISVGDADVAANVPAHLLFLFGTPAPPFYPHPTPDSQ